jgi:hypothetical protein
MCIAMASRSHLQDTDARWICQRSTVHKPQAGTHPTTALVCRLLGPSWLAWQLASGAVLAEASWPLFLVLQLRQGDLTDK